jgi:hypothetical protein
MTRDVGLLAEALPNDRLRPLHVLHEVACTGLCRRHSRCRVIQSCEWRECHHHRDRRCACHGVGRVSADHSRRRGQLAVLVPVGRLGGESASDGFVGSPQTEFSCFQAY